MLVFARLTFTAVSALRLSDWEACRPVQSSESSRLSIYLTLVATYGEVEASRGEGETALVLLEWIYFVVRV